MTGGDGASVPSALALRVWDLNREHLMLRSFNAVLRDPPPWWVASAFSEPAGGWPRDRPLVAECKADGEHTPHTEDCPEGCEEHDGNIPVPDCRCGIYCTRSIKVVSDYLRQASEPVLGLVEMGGRTIMGELGHPGYARGQYARVVAVLLIDRSLTIDHGTLRKVAEAYRVPALVPHSTDPDKFRDRITVTTALADEAEAWLRGLGEGGG
jgi:hypothetical protein